MIRRNTVLKKKLTSNPENLGDYIWLDVHRTHEPNIIKNLRYNAAFTINGFAIPLQEYLKNGRVKTVICLSHAMDDLKHRKLRVNREGYASHAGNLFSCLRFMSLGFEPPSKAEVNLLLDTLPSLEAWRFERNVKKVYSYVGGERNARALANKLGIRHDIFSIISVRGHARKQKL